jgi:ribosomal protein S18 acetylase RimI-like enzyme
VAIADDWQRRGIGTQLVQWLGERAEREGIRRFTALVSIENQPMIGLLRKFDADVEVVSIDGHIIEFDIALRGTRSSAQCA